MSDREVTPSANPADPPAMNGAHVPSASKYRGAVVEDLQLAPAFCLPSSAPLSIALEAAYEREFDHLPILNEQKRPIGYLDVPAIKRKFQQGTVNADDPVRKYTTFFRPFKATSENSGSATDSATETTYKVIHPLTPLEELEEFMKVHDFALVTDQGRKWVLAVATKADLETFVKRRGSF